MSREGSIRDFVLSILSQLADGEYQGIANLAGRDRFSAEQIRHTIESYGRTLIDPRRRRFRTSSSARSWMQMSVSTEP